MPKQICVNYLLLQGQIWVPFFVLSLDWWRLEPTVVWLFDLVYTGSPSKKIHYLRLFVIIYCFFVVFYSVGDLRRDVSRCGMVSICECRHPFDLNCICLKYSIY